MVRRPSGTVSLTGEQLKGVKAEVGDGIRKEGRGQIKLLSLDFSLSAEELIGGLKEGSMTSSNINFKIILHLLCRKGMEGKDRN